MKPNYQRPEANALRMLDEFAYDSARILAEKVGIKIYPSELLKLSPEKNYTAKTTLPADLDNHRGIGRGLNLVVFRLGEGTGSPEPTTPRKKEGAGELFLPLGTFPLGKGWIAGITSLTTYTPNQVGPIPPSLPGRLLVGSTLEDNISTHPREKFGFTYDAIAQEPFGLNHAICWNPFNFVPTHNPETTFQVGGFLEFPMAQRDLFEEVKQRVSRLQ